jgi:hypothetical protein
MRNALIIFGLGLAIATLSVFLTSTPSFALCNGVCMQKCQSAVASAQYPTMDACVKVWSKRNGPSGKGCGKPGEPWQSCGD